MNESPRDLVAFVRSLQFGRAPARTSLLAGALGGLLLTLGGSPTPGLGVRVFMLLSSLRVWPARPQPLLRSTPAVVADEAA